MSDTNDLGKNIKSLPRGGRLVDTSIGYIQFGSPPETVKDTMSLEKGVPRIFILPKHTFHKDKGISVAELEFPIYFNFFILKRKVYIVCTEEQSNSLKIVLQESIFGPRHVDIENEFLHGKNTPGFPDLRAEMNYFKVGSSIDDYVKFCIFRNNKIRINDVKIEILKDESYQVTDRNRVIARFPRDVEYKIIHDVGERPQEPFEPPLMGITCLGPSHGFDPKDNTSGFILWLNYNGIMVDPPVNSTEWLEESNVNPKSISSVILTHCHADHDAGTFQKILEDQRITIYTTETIMDAFVRKYAALTGLSRKRIYELFTFHPVIIGKPIRINNSQFWFHYALHAIPSLQFYFYFHNQSFFYTSDHLHEPDIYETLKEKGILSENRYQYLKDFPWHHNIIYHEAGIPPLHTPIKYLNSLPKEYQKKITVYHIARKDFPEDTDLTIAKFGIENTLYPEIEPPAHQEAYEILDVLSNIDIFQDFSIAKAKEFLSIVKEERFSKGEYVCRKGEEGDKFYIIVRGNVKITGLDEPIDKSYGMYEYFGESSLVLDQKRNADLVATTDLITYSIKKEHFLNFIDGSPLNEALKNLAKIRESNSWTVLSESNTFHMMTSTQKTQLEAIMIYEEFRDGALIIEQDRVFDKGYIIREGLVRVLKNGSEVNTLKNGDFVGEISALQKHSPSGYSFVASGNLEVYSIDYKDMIKYIQKNPRAYMNLLYFYEENV